MVLLTLTAALKGAIQTYNDEVNSLDTLTLQSSDPTLTLESPLGSPISNAQILHIFHALKSHDSTSSPHLADLLQGSAVYKPPPKPQPEKSEEYKALMARLREEAEAREYERMTRDSQKGYGAWGGGSATGTGSRRNPFQKFAVPTDASAWDLGSSAVGAEEDEELSMREINAQLSLVLNVLVSVLAIGVTIFLLSRYLPWSEGARVLMSMLGAVLVGVAEIVLYAGYLRKFGEAKKKERAKKEERVIEDTWLIEGRSKKEIKKQQYEEKKASALEDEGLLRRRVRLK